MITSTLNLGTGLSRTVFRITHNLDEFGMNIESAFDHWRTHRRNLTAEMFCWYIKQKDKAFICLTESEYQTLKKYL